MLGNIGLAINVRPCELIDPLQERLMGIARLNFDIICLSAAMSKDRTPKGETLEDEINRVYGKYANRIKEIKKAYG